MNESLNVVTLCTGNVARSVMLGYMLTSVAEAHGAQWHVRSAGTHVHEGSAMSQRTREALLKIDGLGDHAFGAHRSHQLNGDDVLFADVILASEVDHVRFVQSNFPGQGDRAVLVAQFVRYAPLESSFADQLAAVSASAPLEQFEVVDPAGGDQAIYDACALQLWELSQAFATLVLDSD
jgi:protein-tyrosine-phosphatase